MPYLVIRGTFHVLSRTAGGTVSGFEPDGDSVQFKPSDAALLQRLTRLSQPVRPTAIGSVQLRFEGIDALELHYAGSHQPRALADQARGFLMTELGLDPIQFAAPDGVRAIPPAPNDGAPGFILARSLEVHGRPVSFVFAGDPAQDDGSDLFLDTDLLQNSVNYRSLLNGQAYPLFYDTLFKDLREALAAGAKKAREEGRGLWGEDSSQSGVKVEGQQDLESSAVIFPKLFRRLTDYMAAGNVGLANFLSFPDLHEEQVVDMDPQSPGFTNFTHFDNMIEVDETQNKVSLLHSPETMVFVSAK
jgi:endonuclease YncB( thermonuclease family)